MHSIYTPWAPPTHLPPHKPINIKSKLPTSKTQITAWNNSQDYNNIDADEDDGNSGLMKLALPSRVKSITSAANPFVKHCLKVRQNSSYRHSHGSALVVGTTPIREIYKFERSLQERTIRMDCLILLERSEVPEGLDNISTHTVHVSSMVMKKLSGVQSSDSIEAIALIKIPTSFLNLDINQKEADCQRWFPSTHRILVLDAIQAFDVRNLLSLMCGSCSLQDPGNLGTLLRSAMAFKWGGVFLLPGCCDPFNEKALRASRGACFQLPIVSGSWYHLEVLKDEFKMKFLAGHPESSEDLRSVSELSQELIDSLANVPLCLVLGSEGHGLSEKSQCVCELVSIPMPGEFESLNVSVAGADHFIVACHYVGPRAAEGVPFLVKNAIRVVCSPSYDVAFIRHKDVTFLKNVNRLLFLEEEMI